MSRRRARGLTLVDALTLSALAGVVALVLLPESRVRDIIRVEDDVAATLLQLSRQATAYRDRAARDADGDGAGEYGPLGEMLGDRVAEFTRVEGRDVWIRRGYYYAAMLPGPDRRPVEATSPDVRADFAEQAYLLVAWPVEPGVSGMRAYAHGPTGLLQHAIDGYPYGADPVLPEGPMVEVDASGVHVPEGGYAGKSWVAPVRQIR